MTRALWLLPILALSIVFASRAAAEEIPEWASSLQLAVRGGPAGADIDVRVNGEFVTRIMSGEHPMFQDVADLLRPGENRLEVVLVPAEDARSSPQPVTVAIVPVVVSASRISSNEAPLAEIVVPKNAAAGCAEHSLFWAGPEPTADPTLKETYFVFAVGPPAKVRVTTFVNGRPVYDGSSGDRWLEVTRFVVKGKNEVRFESRPTCLVLPTGREGFLSFSVGPATVEEDLVRQTGPPHAELQVDPRRTVRGETLRRTLRGR